MFMTYNKSTAPIRVICSRVTRTIQYYEAVPNMLLNLHESIKLQCSILE